MRGFPLLQLLLTLIVFAAAGWPVWSLTRPATADAAIAPAALAGTSAPAETVTVEAAFAPPPTDFSVNCLGQPVLAGLGPQTQFAAPWAVLLPPEGADLVVEAHWPVASSPAAMRVIVRFPDGRTVEKSFWAPRGGAFADVLTVPGAAVTVP